MVVVRVSVTDEQDPHNFISFDLLGNVTAAILSKGRKGVNKNNRSSRFLTKGFKMEKL
jgi:hypothetical protein